MPDNKLPIKKLTLYKHGVGFVERAGKVEQKEVELVFRHDEVNDALKSLLVLDKDGGQIRGIHYETPGAKSLSGSRIELSAENSLLDLLKSLRGRMVRLVFGEGSNTREVSGQLLGVDVDNEKPLTRSRVAIQEQDGDQPVGNYPLADLTTLYLLDDRTRQDLRYFLDSSRNDELHRTVTIELDSNTAKELQVSYLVPCPTWRVTYRLVAETTAAKPAEKAESEKAETTGAAEPAETATAKKIEDLKGELILQGWGLFDNRLEEDLVEVGVKLVAGQPISFIYDLTTSQVPQRPFVRDEARVAAGPVEFEAALAPMAVHDASREEMDSLQAFGFAEEAAAPAGMNFSMRPAAKPAPAPQPSRRKMMEQQPVAAKGSDLGELFQYEVIAPVTVKRGESALVPILNNSLPYRHELLYNNQKMAKHPVATLRFKNETGLVLERGPVTIIEDDEYRGEAIISFTPNEHEIYLAFAVELGIKVTEERQQTTQTTGIRIANSYMYFDQVVIITTTYKVENTLAQDRVVTIEKPLSSGYDITSAKPFESTAEVNRWKVGCPAKHMTIYKVEERTTTYSSQAVLNTDYTQLQSYLRSRWLTEEVAARIREILVEQEAINKNQAEMNNASVEKNEIYNRQEQIRRNMSSLRDTGDEGVLRKRQVEQLSQAENRISQIDELIVKLKNENQERQQRINVLLSNLKA